MKLSHLSLAILSAIALAACGGSGSDHTTPEKGSDHTDTNTDMGKDKDKGKEEVKEEEEKKEVPKEDAEIVDPTGDQVVDAINLAETSTTASQQYLRGAQSEFDRSANPDKAGSATALSGITLDVQNPNLTNIVVARVEGNNGKGEKVQIAQYLGSTNSQMGSLQDNNNDGNPDGVVDPNSLQALNAPNALVSNVASNSNTFYAANGNPSQNDAYVTYGLGALTSPLFRGDANAQAYANQVAAYYSALSAYNTALEAYKANPQDAAGAGTGQDLSNAIDALDAAAAAVVIPADFSSKYKIRSEANTSYTTVDKTTLDGNLNNLQNAASQSIGLLVKDSSLSKYGAGLFQFSFSNSNVGGVWGNGWGDIVAGGKVTGVAAGNGVQGGPTHGLVGVWSQGGKSIARGTEESNIRDSRIFGHYYRDPGLNGAGDGLANENANSWRRPATFITRLNNKNAADKFGLGAEAQQLNSVQYGRVTAEVDAINLATEAKTTGWDFRVQNAAAHDNAKLDAADDFYFYRGTNATTIDQMAKLPSDTKIAYEGHALMYGIDNSFHGNGQNLPNSFGSTQDYGLGNFVKATLDTGKKEFAGSVFNAWHNEDLKSFKEDTLVEFSGKVTGNTVIGEANRTYVTETRPADFRASFFGANADEVGGAFNAVKSSDPYGDPAWGGVFGAKRVSSSDSAWLVSSEKQ